MKKQLLTYLLMLVTALPLSAAVGDVFFHQGVQYKITNQHEVSAVHYDSAYIVIPDSVSNGSRNYAVTEAITWYNPQNCSLRHYHKIDMSAATNITSLASQSSGLIAIDTLILPPNLLGFPSCFWTTDSLDYMKRLENENKLLPGIHRVYTTGTQDIDVGIDMCTSLLEADLSSYTTTFSNGSDYAFQSNPFLQKLILPNTIKIFGAYMFLEDIRLSELSIPDSLEKILNHAFCGIAMDTLRLGTKVYQISPLIGTTWQNLRWIEVDPTNPYYMSENGVLYTKDLYYLWVYPYSKDDQEYSILQNTQSIACFALGQQVGNGAFDMEVWKQQMEEGKLKKITFNYSLLEINHSAFEGSSIKEFKGLGDTQVRTIAYDCFRRSAVESIYFPETLKEIGFRAFAETPNLQQLGTTLSQNLQTIGEEAFRDAWKLEELDLFGCNALVDIPKSMCLRDSSLTYVGLPRYVQTIGDQAFKDCSSLQEILCPAIDPIPVNPSVFEGVPKWNCVLFVPAGSVDKYKKAKVWKDFYNIQAAPLYYIATDVTDSLAGWIMGGGLYQKGEHATVIAIPYEGYEFVTWSDGVTNNPRFVYVKKDMSLVAEFVKRTEAIETPTPSTPTSRKRIENGQIFILRGDKVYTTTGQEVE